MMQDTGDDEFDFDDDEYSNRPNNTSQSGDDASSSSEGEKAVPSPFAAELARRAANGGSSNRTKGAARSSSAPSTPPPSAAKGSTSTSGSGSASRVGTGCNNSTGSASRSQPTSRRGSGMTSTSNRSVGSHSRKKGSSRKKSRSTSVDSHGGSFDGASAGGESASATNSVGSSSGRHFASELAERASRMKQQQTVSQSQSTFPPTSTSPASSFGTTPTLAVVPTTHVTPTKVSLRQPHFSSPQQQMYAEANWNAPPVASSAVNANDPNMIHPGSFPPSSGETRRGQEMRDPNPYQAKIELSATTSTSSAGGTGPLETILSCDTGLGSNVSDMDGGGVDSAAESTETHRPQEEGNRPSLSSLGLRPTFSIDSETIGSTGTSQPQGISRTERERPQKWGDEGDKRRKEAVNSSSFAAFNNDSIFSKQHGHQGLDDGIEKNSTSNSTTNDESLFAEFVNGKESPTGASTQQSQQQALGRNNDHDVGTSTATSAPMRMDSIASTELADVDLLGDSNPNSNNVVNEGDDVDRDVNDKHLRSDFERTSAPNQLNANPSNEPLNSGTSTENEEQSSSEYEIFDMNQPQTNFQGSIDTDKRPSSDNADPNEASSTQQHGRHVPGLKAVSGFARRVGGAGGAGRRSPTNVTGSTNLSASDGSSDRGDQPQQNQEAGGGNINQRAGQLFGFANRAIRNRVQNHPQQQHESNQEELTLSIEEETSDGKTIGGESDEQQQQHPDRAAQAAAAALAARQAAAKSFGGLANRIRHAAEQRAQQQQQQQHENDHKNASSAGGEIRQKSSQEDDYMNFLNFHVKKKTANEDETQSTGNSESKPTSDELRRNDNSALGPEEKYDNSPTRQTETSKKAFFSRLDKEKAAAEGESSSSSFSPTRTFLSARAAMSELVDKKTVSGHGANDQQEDKSLGDSQHDGAMKATSGKEKDSSSDLLSSFSPSRSLASARAAVTEFAAKRAKEEDNKVEAIQQNQLSMPKMDDALSSTSTLSANDASSAGALFNRFRGKAMSSLSNHGGSQREISIAPKDEAEATIVALPQLKKSSVHLFGSEPGDSKNVVVTSETQQSIATPSSEVAIPQGRAGSVSVDAVVDSSPHKKSLDWAGWQDYSLPASLSPSSTSGSFSNKFIGLEVQHPYSQLILKGEKTIDVRRYKLPPALLFSASTTSRRTPILILETGSPSLGQKVVAKQSGLGNILKGEDTINSKIQIVGWCFISDIIHYTSGGQFALDQQLHCVTSDSEYGWMEGFTKELFGWALTEAGSFSASATSEDKDTNALADLPKAEAMIRRMRSLFEIQFSDDQARAISAHMLATSTALEQRSSQENITVTPPEEMKDTTKSDDATLHLPSNIVPSKEPFFDSTDKAKPTKESETPESLISSTESEARTHSGDGAPSPSSFSSSNTNGESSPVHDGSSSRTNTEPDDANRSASPSASATSSSPPCVPLNSTLLSSTSAPSEKSEISTLHEEFRSKEEEYVKQQKEFRRRQEESQQVIKQLREALEKTQGQVSSMTQSNSLLSKRCETLQTNQKEQESLMTELQMAYSKQMEQNGELSHTTKSLKDKLSKTEYALKTEQSEHRRTKEALDLSKATHASEVDALKVERDKLEKEISQLKKQAEFRTSHESTTLARLNESKKLEAMKTREVSALQTELNELRPKLMAVTKERDKAIEERNKLSSSVDKIKSKCVERVRLAEEALEKELDLNEERKRKMKEYVNTKADELRRAKDVSDAYRLEVEEMRQHYKSTRDKLEEAQTNLKNREEMIEALKEDLHQLQTQSENLHKMGDTLESQLSKSAREKEEHKHKRLEAKQELMSLLRKLESEQKVSKELRDKIKFKFTPQALSQQQQLNDGMEELERALLRLSRRLGKSLPPRPGATTVDGSSIHGSDRQASNREMASLAASSGTESSRGDNKQNSSSSRKNHHAAGDATRILDAFGDEQESVQLAIDSLLDSLERIHILLDDRNGERNCISHVAEILSRIAAGGTPLVPVSTHGQSRSGNGNRMDGGGRLRAFATSATRSRTGGGSSFERLPFNPDDTSIL